MAGIFLTPVLGFFGPIPALAGNGDFQVIFVADRLVVVTQNLAEIAIER